METDALIADADNARDARPRREQGHSSRVQNRLISAAEAQRPAHAHDAAYAAALKDKAAMVARQVEAAKERRRELARQRRAAKRGPK